MKLCGTEWDVLTEIDGEKTIKDIAKRLQYKENTVKLAVYNLLDESLIEQIVLPADIYVDVKHIKGIEVQLTKILGPVAGIIIDDVLADMNLTRSTIKKAEIYMFVEAISNEINDTNKKLEFQEAMLDSLSEIGDA